MVFSLGLNPVDSVDTLLGCEFRALWFISLILEHCWLRLLQVC